MAVRLVSSTLVLWYASNTPGRYGLNHIVPLIVVLRRQKDICRKIYSRGCADLALHNPRRSLYYGNSLIIKFVLSFPSTVSSTMHFSSFNIPLGVTCILAICATGHPTGTGLEARVPGLPLDSNYGELDVDMKCESGTRCLEIDPDVGAPQLLHPMAVAKRATSYSK